MIPLAELPWLVMPPNDFRRQIKDLESSNAVAHELFLNAKQLASYRLNNSQLHSLGNVLSNIRVDPADVALLGVLSNGTVDHIMPGLAVSGLRHGVWVRSLGTAFDQVAAEALNPQSTINQARCQFVLFCLDHRGLPLRPMPGNAEGAQEGIAAAFRYLDTLRHGIRSASDAALILQTIPQVPDGSFGSAERCIPGTLQWLIERFNAELRERVANSPDFLLDTAALAENIGLTNWQSSVEWMVGKFCIPHSFTPLYVDWVGRLIGAARGKSRKCLVLDLDNTLWGGVVGEAGYAGIVLGNGSAVGEAFLSVQQAALELRNRGILLAISSKNDEHVAREVFGAHPEMLLREQHLAMFQANWQDKATNIQAIARELSIGLDAIVLLDDNPAERAQVRDALPMVAVPELPEDPALFKETLLAAGYFEALRLTPEDRNRASMYQENAVRAKLLETTADLGSYLSSLLMRAICRPFDSVGRGRITQLINKTNQFNLTTRRYTEAEVEALERSAALTLQMRLLDRFGDNGVIAIVICVAEGENWALDTWLMSCRVLNRKVEEATLSYIVAHAKLAGARALIGRYVPTERNGMVADHYARLGFTLVSERGAGTSEWSLALSSYIPSEVPIEVVAESLESYGLPGGADLHTQQATMSL